MNNTTNVSKDTQTRIEADCITNGEAVLGIELGSTRIKAVLIGDDYRPIVSGGHSWENQLVDGVWTYSLDAVHAGLQAAYADLKAKVQNTYGATLERVKAIGISAMMHGYLAFDAEGKLLTPFRTWRNNITATAVAELTELFGVNIPQRWSIAHLHRAVLQNEAHVQELAYMTTLAGYLHWQLTGKKVIGVGDASGMFPIAHGTFDTNMVEAYEKYVEPQGFPWKLRDVLPKVLLAGESAGTLTNQGAIMLDPSGDLEAGIPLCPPEGDAGTGMVATNSVAVRSGNVSAGTSIFAMIVLEHGLKKVHEELDMITTPDGLAVGLVHSNNCTSDLDAWVSLFAEAVDTLGLSVDKYKLMDDIMGTAVHGDKDCGGLLNYGYLSGEHITGFSEGRPLFVRGQNAKFTLANFIRSHFCTALCALRKGMDILTQEEGVHVDSLCGHGGFFKAPDVGDQIMADAFNVPVTTMTTAGEGGAWGIALLAAFGAERFATIGTDEVASSAGASGAGGAESATERATGADPAQRDLPTFLAEVFANAKTLTKQPDPAGVAGFTTYYQRHSAGLSIEAEAVKRV